MERIRYIAASIFMILVLALPARCEEPNLSLSTFVTPQNVQFASCTKIFNIPAEKLFYLAVSSAAANRFKIEEIQSKTGYILFTAVNKQFLASISKVDNSRTLLKITPTNNVYYFPPGIVLNFFKYIELNASSPLTSIPPQS